ncbi:MAG: hypothetical protein HY366_01220, partial [Candidatus Aenigmarchaeota archaeon]|nr:hypothetical protein [Candidatus Aenigmarchaeota archaeon]
MLYVTACVAGVFALNKDLRVVAFELFPKDAETIRERMHVLSKGQVVPELETLLSRLDDKTLVTDLMFEREGFKITRDANNAGTRHLQDNMRTIAIEAEFVTNVQELNELLSAIARLETKSKLRTKPSKDRLVIQAVAAMEDLTEITNLMSERLHEWYGIYNPELERSVRDNERYARSVVEGAKKGDESVGTYVEPGDMETIKLHAAETVGLFALRKNFEDYLELTMPEIAPNTAAIAGPVLAARLIKHAGSLERLAKLPASTIQILGAEKALFRFMKARKGGRGAGDARPPKYGLLFVHEYVQNAPAERRGKVARTLAAKISLAAKTDFYSGDDRSAAYAADLKEKIRA